MRILLVTSYYEPDQGAAAIILTRLAKKLHQRGHQVTVLTSLPNYPHGRILDGYRGRFVVVEERDGIRVIQTWLWATPSPRISRKFISQITFAITAILRGLVIPRPDVMLIVAQPIFTNLGGVLLSRLKRVPYVLDVHDLWPDHMLSIGALTERHPVYRLFRWLVDQTYKGASAIIALTPHLEKVIRSYLPPADKVQTIYSGVDLERFQPGLDAAAFRAKYELGNARLVAYIGTLGTAYDCMTMLETAKRFVNRKDAIFAIIGTGTQKEVVRSRLAQGDLPNVRWIEWVDYAEIPQAWAATHIAYWALHNHPLHRGAIGTKMYEAMASGVPVAVALEGVVADVLHESGGGFSVAFGDVDGLSEVIRRLLDDPELHRRTSQAARAYAEQHFDAERTAAAYEQTLQRAANRSTSTTTGLPLR
ncbi:MAG: glycosyltransferase family 4 protein [Chloroflexi bacterium]|nr:glycosyltransferase family 4 protein [Chloroflexota bacterium]